MNRELIIAIHALVFLKHRGSYETSETIAANVCTNPVCIRKVMTRLARSGLVLQRRGRKIGGYCYGSGKVTLDRVVQSLALPIIKGSWQSGDEQAECLISSGMNEIVEKIDSDLNTLCLNRLSQITIDDIESQLIERSTTR